MRLRDCAGWAAALAIVGGGCSRLTYEPSPPPPGFSDRLMQLEHERLAARGPQRPIAARTAARSMSIAGRAESGLPGPAKPADDSYALMDMAGATEGAPDPAADAARKEDIYARRPPLDSFGQTVKRDVQNMGRDLWRDTKRVYGNPINLIVLGAAYGGALAVQETGPDGTVERHYDRHRAYSNDWADAFGAMGNPGTHFALAGLMYLVGQQSQDDKTYEVGKTLFSALIINGLSTMVGQAASSDKAPNGEWGTFPSGHTSSTFCVATVLNEAYGPLVGVPMYGLGVLVGVERLNSGEHYLSDVLFGAVMGTVIGHSVASGRDPELFGWKVLPYADPATGSSGMALMKSF
ncbi:MAG: phosphatase PAP2 family protein [Phycisphaerae bacterium]|nr:phosphatase PAP2 family protein [Phycisphaerae bacterium]